MKNNEAVLKENWGYFQREYPMLDFLIKNQISIQISILAIADKHAIEFAPNNKVNKAEIDRAIQIYLREYYKDRSNFRNYSQIITDRDRSRVARLSELIRDTNFKVSHFTYGNVIVYNLQVSREISILVSPVQLVIRQVCRDKYMTTRFVRKTATDSLRPFLPLVKTYHDNNILTAMQYQEVMRILVPTVDLRKPVTKRGSN